MVRKEQTLTFYLLHRCADEVDGPPATQQLQAAAARLRLLAVLADKHSDRELNEICHLISLGALGPHAEAPENAKELARELQRQQEADGFTLYDIYEDQSMTDLLRAAGYGQGEVSVLRHIVAIVRKSLVSLVQLD